MVLKHFNEQHSTNFIGPESGIKCSRQQVQCTLIDNAIPVCNWIVLYKKYIASKASLLGLETRPTIETIRDAARFFQSTNAISPALAPSSPPRPAHHRPVAPRTTITTATLRRPS